MRRSVGWRWGSPPHMRGKAATGLNAASSSRITPAHAGKSYIRPALLRPEWDHPRTCGEKICIGLALVIMPGSPPHMRGKDGRRKKRNTRTRITPAHAGKRQSLLWCRPVQWDHPRTCGEKRAFILLYSLYVGITPAHAGKRLPAFLGRRSSRDHPRTCGEKALPWDFVCKMVGSPPHMRGKD